MGAVAHQAITHPAIPAYHRLHLLTTLFLMLVGVALLVTIHRAIAALPQATLHVMLSIIRGVVAQAVTTVLGIVACQISLSLVTRARENNNV